MNGTRIALTTALLVGSAWLAGCATKVPARPPAALDVAPLAIDAARSNPPVTAIAADELASPRSEPATGPATAERESVRPAEPRATQQHASPAQQHASAPQQHASGAQQRAQSPIERRAMFENELRDLVATKSDRGRVVTLNDVLFDPDSATLRPGGQRLVARLAMLLRQNPERTIAIEGFADSDGGDAQSQDLSERRAASVQLALTAAGVDGSRVYVRGYGKAFPVASNDTREGRQRNRRVEVVISDEGGAIAPRVASIAGR